MYGIDHDERSPEEVRTHPVLIAMTDRCLSGWGKAEGGTSVCAWACRPDDADQVERWVRHRSDAMRVRIVGHDWRPRGAAHATVYVVRDGHPALRF